MKIFDYRVVPVIEVKVMLKEGWEPYCGPILHEHNFTFYQALVKWSKE